MGVDPTYNPYTYSPAYGNGYTPGYNQRGFHWLGALIVVAMMGLIVFVGYQKFFQHGGSAAMILRTLAIVRWDVVPSAHQLLAILADDLV